MRSLPMPMITPTSRAGARCGPRPSARACARIGGVEADEDRLADQEVADVELDDLAGCAATGPTVSKVEAVAGVDFEAERRPKRGGVARCARSSRRRRSAPRRAPRSRRRCAVRRPARRALPPPRSARGSASMNSETRMPASLERADHAAAGDCAGRRRRGRPRSCAPRAAPARCRRRAGDGAARWPASRRSPPSRG